MTRPLTIDDLYRFAIPADPVLSPDGDRVVYTLTTQDAEHDRAACSLWEVRTDGGPARRLTRGPADAAPRWSPDGTTVAFLREGRIHLLPATGGEAAPLADGEPEHGGGVPVWSPDGTRIAFAAPACRPDPAAPVVIDRLGYKADGDGAFGPVRTHLFVADVATGESRQLTHGDFHAGPPAWSPDGSRLAFPASIGGDTDVTGASAAYVIDVDADGAMPRLTGPATGLIGPVDWFADGTALLVVGRTTVSAGHLALLRQPLDGGAPVPLTGALDRNVMPGGPGYPGALPQFRGADIVFCARDRGVTRLYQLAADKITEFPLAEGTGVGGCSVAAKAGRAALLVSDRSSFGEIALLDLDTGSTTRLTEHTAEALAGVTLHPSTEREFTISDGTRVHGFVVRDPKAPSHGPLLVDVHGGPHNAWSPHADPVHLYHQELASRGWTILALNIRGSDGYGEAFYTAAIGAWGDADEKDVLEPVAELVAEGLADPGRIALTGYSYGGYLACWLSARSDVFAAVVPGGVVTDLISMAGTSDTGHDLFTTEIGDRDRQVALSPLSHVDAVRAPTLILHGEADDTCPVGQAEQWFHALRVRDVPVRLVRYPGASHLFVLSGRPSHRADYSRRLVGWVTGHTALRTAGADHD
ncbi:S9 family peptidase [Streptomyces spiramyceticus]|uniref:S9 family peptidase n=1 Tax=Streptomyces spiramyceticus TaxID=299717 RepID=UPI00237BE982|nr:S9 family peptidase [Streptomyces spiramyceticus]